MSQNAGTSVRLMPDADTPKTLTCMAVAKEMVILSVPIFFTRASWVIMKVTDTALLGHAGTDYLKAASLSDLWTQTTGVFIMSRAMSTLASQALGAGNKQMVGIWMQVAFAVLMPVCVVVAITWALTGVVLAAAGKAPDVVDNAQYYSLVLMTALPVRIIFAQYSSFLTAQKIMMPGVYCSTFSMVFNLLFGLPLVLGIPFPNWAGIGFKACPVITTVMEWLQVFFLLWIFIYKQQLGSECWPGWSMKHVTRDRVKVYLGQYIPSSLSLGSDFWRVGIIGVVASSLGDDNLVVWNASYRICWISLTFLGSIGSAMSILLGQSLGGGRASDAKLIANTGLSIAVVMGVVLSVTVAAFPRAFGSIFSADETILLLFEEARYPMAAFVLTMNIGTMMETIPMATGRMRTAFYAGIAGSWLGQVPCVFLCTYYWRKDLLGLYTGVACGYLLLIILLSFAIWGIDWDDVVKEAIQRSEGGPLRIASMQPIAGDDKGAASMQASMQPIAGNDDKKNDMSEKEEEEAPAGSGS